MTLSRLRGWTRQARMGWFRGFARRHALYLGVSVFAAGLAGGFEFSRGWLENSDWPWEFLERPSADEVSECAEPVALDEEGMDPSSTSAKGPKATNLEEAASATPGQTSASSDLAAHTTTPALATASLPPADSQQRAASATPIKEAKPAAPCLAASAAPANFTSPSAPQNPAEFPSRRNSSNASAMPRPSAGMAPGGGLEQKAIVESAKVGAVSSARAAARIPKISDSVRARVIRQVSTSERLVALSFDDGPSPSSTMALINTLESRGANATFFFVGRTAAAYPELVAEVSRRGFEIGNHSQTHSDLRRLGGAAAWEDMAKAERALRDAGAQDSIPLWRFPYGNAAEPLRQRAFQSGKIMVGWNIDPADWKSGATSEKILKSIRSNLIPGSIILLHDRPRPALQALPALLDLLEQEGYRAVSVGELLSAGTPEP